LRQQSVAGATVQRTGRACNWTDDTDHDGHQDLLRQDMYPESTVFCQIGIMGSLQTTLPLGKIPVQVDLSGRQSMGGHAKLGL
jgi:hypothetical protein